jgi:hypothetical protein
LRYPFRGEETPDEEETLEEETRRRLLKSVVYPVSLLPKYSYLDVE